MRLNWHGRPACVTGASLGRPVKPETEQAQLLSAMDQLRGELSQVTEQTALVRARAQQRVDQGIPAEAVMQERRGQIERLTKEVLQAPRDEVSPCQVRTKPGGAAAAPRRPRHRGQALREAHHAARGTGPPRRPCQKPGDGMNRIAP